MKKLLTLLILSIFTLTLTSCDNSVIITYEANGGTPLEPITVNLNSLITFTESTEKEGYTFINWYYDEELTSLCRENSEIYSDITLYAKWEINTYVVTYDISEFDDQDISYTSRVEHNLTASLSDLPIENHIFIGWFEDEDYLIPYDEDALIIEDITIYGKYLEIKDKIALITDGGSVDDGSYNEMVFNGAYLFAEEANLELVVYQPSVASTEAYLEAITLAINDGAEVIICPGWLFDFAVYEAQTLYPNITFLLIDGSPSSPDYSVQYTATNTITASFAVQDAGFLAGYSAVKEGFTSLGFIGGMPIPTVVEYGIGFIAGAYYAADEMGVDITFSDNTFVFADGFAPSNEITSLANGLFSTGVEIIFSVSGGGNISVINVAEQTNNHVIGVDVDMSASSDTVVTSAMKSLDIATYTLLYGHYNGLILGGTDMEFTASNLGVRLPFETSDFSTFTVANYEAILLKIQFGGLFGDSEITIPSTYEELVIFLGEHSSNFTEGSITSHH